MPFLAPIGAWIAANAAALSAATTVATAGTEIGLQASGALQPSTSGQLKEQQRLAAEQQQKQQQTMEQSLFKHFAPDAQGQTGGALGDQSLSAMIAELAGAPGDINLAQSTIFGQNPQNPPGGATEPTPGAGGPGLSSTSVGGG